MKDLRCILWEEEEEEEELGKTLKKGDLEWGGGDLILGLGFISY